MDAGTIEVVAEVEAFTTIITIVYSLLGQYRQSCAEMSGKVKRFLR